MQGMCLALTANESCLAQSWGWLRVAVHLCPVRDTHSSPAALRFESSDLCLEFVHHDLQLQVFVPQAT